MPGRKQTFSLWKRGSRTFLCGPHAEGDAKLIVATVNALSALGDPVVVAEALPELIRSLEFWQKAHKAGQYEPCAAAYDAANIVLSKLKAQP